MGNAINTSFLKFVWYKKTAVLYKKEFGIRKSGNFINYSKFMVEQPTSSENITAISNDFFSNPKNRIYWHLALIIFMILSAYFREISYTPLASFIFKGTVVVMLIALFYSNVYWLVPKYLFKRKFSFYLIISFVFIAIIYSAMLFLFDVLKPYHLEQPYNVNSNQGEMSILFFIFMIVVLIAASAAVRLFDQWISDKKMIVELEKSKTSAELEQLKNQINPHFLFNMLNNANVLTKKDPEKASVVLMGLSDLLRYQLYDSSREKVLLTAEIRFLEDFLNLEKIRRDDFTFTITKNGELNGVQLSPLLFITFVENAVKHNNGAGNTTFVNLFFSFENNILLFKCVNSKPLIKAVNTTGGLGLTNVKKRLKLLYPERHALNIEESDVLFSVTLTINL